MLDFFARAIEHVRPKYGCLLRNDRRRFPWICDKTQSFASAIGAVNIEIRSKRVVIFFTVKLKRKLPNRTKPNNKAQEKFEESCNSSAASKKWLRVGLVARV